MCVGGLPLVMDVSYCNTYYEDSDSLTFPGNVSSSSFTLALRISPISSPAQVKEIVRLLGTHVASNALINSTWRRSSSVPCFIAPLTLSA